MFSLCRHLSAIRFQLILAFSATPIDFLFVYKTNEYYTVFRFFLIRNLEASTYTEKPISETASMS